MADENDEPRAKTNYQGNSQKAKGEPERSEPKLQPITSAKERKKPLGKKIAEAFTGDDATSVGSYLLFDVVIPATKNLISEMVGQGIDRVLFGDSRGRRSTAGRGGASYTSYSRSSTGATRSDLDRPGGGGRQFSDRGRRTHDFAEIIIDDRGEAEQVIDMLNELIETYGAAKVSDLYDLVELSGSYVDEKWGWDDLRGAEVRRIRAGYILDLPRPIQLD